MSKWFKEMDCYVLAGGEENPKRDFDLLGELTRLEKSFRSYAAIFEKVKLVIKEKQAREKYLNYPYVCDIDETPKATVGVATALEDADSDAIFIGTSDISDFPISLLANLVKNYNGEAFLGYVDKNNKHQPLFGIYNKKVKSKIEKTGQLSLENLEEDEIKLLELPENFDADCIGL